MAGCKSRISPPSPRWLRSMRMAALRLASLSAVPGVTMLPRVASNTSFPSDNVSGSPLMPLPASVS